MSNSPPPPPPPPPGSPSEPSGWGSESPGSSGWSSGFPPPPSGAGFGAPSAWGPANQPKRSGLAIAALVLGIVAIPLFLIFLPALLALIFGLVAASTIKKQSIRERLGLARAGWILGVVSVVAGVGVWIAVAVYVGDTEAWYDLEVGDCVADFEFDQWDGSDRIEVVDCSDSHNAEVVAVEELNPDQDLEYPDRSEQNRMAEELCPPALEDYTDEPYMTGPYNVFTLGPDESAWKDTNGTFVCLGSENDRSDRTGSIAG